MARTGVFLARLPRPSELEALLPTHVGLIDLNLARERRVVVLSHELVADEVQHPPGGLVGHAQLAL